MNSVLSFPTLPQAASAISDSGPRLSVNLAAIRANYLEMRRRYRGQVLAAVVKSLVITEEKSFPAQAHERLRKLFGPEYRTRGP
jgi:hypothetical protein